MTLQESLAHNQSAMLYTTTTSHIAALIAKQHAALAPQQTARWLPTLASCLATLSPTTINGRGYAKKRIAADEQNEEGIDMYLEQLRPKTPPKRVFTEEQLAEREQRAKEFSRNMMQWKIMQEANLMRKAEIMTAAFEALPKHLKQAAAKPDYELFPTDRPMFGETPPIVWYREWKRKQG